MGAAGKLQTQTEEFWRDEYQVSEADIDLITNQILENGRPLRIEALASAIILRRYQREREAATLHAQSGDIYQPLGSYQVGQRLLFTEFDFATGRVIAIRPGYNPKYGPFNVIQVQFESELPDTEFACDFPYPHALNRPVEEILGKGDESLSESDLVSAFGELVVAKLEPTLSSNHDFVTFDERWFLRELLPDMHVGFLNLAEALIDQGRHPLAAREILADLDLQITASPEAQLFALNLALGHDKRFVNVSLDENPVWYLQALMPEAAFKRPAVLQPAMPTLGGEYIGSTLLEQVEEIGDELDNVSNDHSPNGEIHIELSFPHLVSGTLPASKALQSLLPKSQAPYIPVTLLVNHSNEMIEAWLCPAEGYICGLAEWFKRTGVCVGAIITLAKLDRPLTLGLSLTPIRGKKSEWICSATVNEGVLVLKNQRATLQVKADRNMVIDVPDPQAIVSLMEDAEAAGTPLSTIVYHVFEELAKQSSKGGSVHAKSVYSAVNLVRRFGAVPVFAELTHRACFDPVGGGYWALDPTLQKTTYQTPEEMFERPLSNRRDTVKDPVIQYGRR